MNILRDFQCWGVVGTFLSIAVAFWIYLLQKNKKRMAYQILTETPLLSVNDEIKGKIQIKYEEKNIQNIHLVVLKVENIGNLDIPSSDFEQPIIITFPDSEILSAEVSDAFPKNLQPLINFEISKLTMQPILLNKKDFISFKIVFSKYNNVIDFNARIIGVKGIEMAVAGETNSKASPGDVFAILFVVAFTSFVSNTAIFFAFLAGLGDEQLDIGLTLVLLFFSAISIPAYIYAYTFFSSLTKRK